MSFRNAVIIAMITFVLFIGYMVVVITNESSELISEDYYEQEQTLDADMAAKQRAQAANLPLKLIAQNGLLSFVNHSDLNIEKLHVSFMCYNDKLGDVEFDIHPNASIPIAQLKKGTYAVEMRYQVNGKTYLQQSSYQRK
jgi:hypothetical protein